MRHWTTWPVAIFVLASCSVWSAELSSELREAPTSGVRWLNDRVALEIDAAGGRELDLLGSRLLLGPQQSSHWSGGTVVVSERRREGDRLALYSGSGVFLRATEVAAGLDALAYGEVVVSFAAGLHEPRLDYALQFDVLGKRTNVAREQREVLDLRPLETHLAVTSVASGDPSTLEVDVYDGRARVVLRVADPHGRQPRVVATRSGHIAALFPGSRTTQLTTKAPDGVERRIELPGPRLTDLAFLDGTGDILVWGRHDVALVSNDVPTTSWRTDLSTLGRLIGNETSSVGVHGDQVVVLAAVKDDDGSTRVRLTRLDRLTGEPSEIRELFVTGGSVRSSRRFVRGKAELLVVADQVWEASSDRGDR